MTEEQRFTVEQLDEQIQEIIEDYDYHEVLRFEQALIGGGYPCIQRYKNIKDVKNDLQQACACYKESYFKNPDYVVTRYNMTWEFLTLDEDGVLMLEVQHVREVGIGTQADAYYDRQHSK